MSDNTETITEQVSENSPELTQVEQGKTDQDWNALQKQLRIAKKENEQLKSATTSFEDDKVANLEERGQYKEINRILKDKNTDLETKLEVVIETATKSADFESSFRAQALETLPENFKKYGETMELAELLNFVKDHSNIKPATDNDLPGKRAPVTAREISKMSRVDRNKNWADILESYKNTNI